MNDELTTYAIAERGRAPFFVRGYRLPDQVTGYIDGAPITRQAIRAVPLASSSPQARVEVSVEPLFRGVCEVPEHTLGGFASALDRAARIAGVRQMVVDTACIDGPRLNDEARGVVEHALAACQD